MMRETPWIKLELEAGILVATYRQGIRIDLPIAKEIVQERLSFTGPRQLPALVISQGVISMDKAAREYLASPEATAGLTATAVLVNSAFSSFLGNFFRTVNKPGTMPVKVFRHRQGALKWLGRYFPEEYNTHE